MTEENKPKEDWNIEPVSTATENLICDKEGVAYSDREVLLVILRKVNNLEKKVVG